MSAGTSRADLHAHTNHTDDAIRPIDILRDPLDLLLRTRVGAARRMVAALAPVPPE